MAMSEQPPGTFGPLLKTVKTPRNQISLWLVADAPIGKTALVWLKRKLDEEDESIKGPDMGYLHRGISSQKLFISRPIFTSPDVM